LFLFLLPVALFTLPDLFCFILTPKWFSCLSCSKFLLFSLLVLHVVL
jgi:hypothetical protein